MKTEELHKIFSTCNFTVCTDTRNITQGSLYFALKGTNHDGNRFIGEALEKGCRYAVSDNPPQQNNPNVIYTKDTLIALQELARFHRKLFNIPVLAITGSNGKTTTKELIAAVLGKKYEVVSTQGNLNNHIGVPLTLLRINNRTQIAIIEMGANHTGEINSLCEIAQPGYGIITNIGKAHIEGFGSLEGVIKAKTELYRYLSEHNGTVFVNSGNNVLTANMFNNDTVTYSHADDADVSGKIINAGPFIELDWYKPGNGGHFSVKTKIYGSYNLENILAAICIGNYFNVEPSSINEALNNYTPSNNRSQIIETLCNVIILDAYNANPASMKVAIENFENLAAPAKAMIIGDMLELGKEEETEHVNILKLAIKSGIPEVYFVGKVFSSVEPEIPFMRFQDVGSLKTYLRDNPIKGRHILIKASRGIQLEKVTEVL